MQATGESESSREAPLAGAGLLWACRASALAAAAVIWIYPGAFFHFSDKLTAINPIALVPATFPFGVVLFRLRRNSPRRGDLQLAAGAALTALIFISGSYLRASKQAWAPPALPLTAALPQLSLIATALKNHGPVIREQDYGLRFFSGAALGIFVTGIFFIIAVFMSGTVK